MKAAAFDYESPRDVAAALALAIQADGGAKYVAGSQSLGPMLNLRLVQPALLIDVRRIGELAEVGQSDDAVRFGACTSHAAIEDGVVPDPTRGLMPFVARGIAYRPVRNRGTIGGSLAHADPAADWVTAMALLGAVAIVRGPTGERRIALESFFSGAYTTALGDDDLLVAVDVPKLSAAARWGYYKICRKTGEFAQAIGAVLIDPLRGIERSVVGAADGAPIVLEGRAAIAGVVGTLAERVRTDDVKRHLLRVALVRATALACGRAAA